ncbi:leucyl aminopeptidase [Candidatus Uhrbacteria bacterium]|nr:leucyl aminopeptidase [Candidatus Uhrbacteria bacterium]
MKYSYRSPYKEKPQTPVIAVFAEQKMSHPFLRTLDEQDARYVSAILKDFKAGWLEMDAVSLPSRPAAHAILLGLGDRKKWTHRKMYLATRKLVQYVKGAKEKTCSVLLDDVKIPGLSLEHTAERFAREAELAQYEFNHYRETPKEGWPSIDEIFVYTKVSSASRSVQKALERGGIVGEQVNRSRELANIPGGDMTPKRLAAAAQEDGKRFGFTVTVLGEPEMKKLKMGALLGVSQGSDEEAQLIVMEYRGGAKSKKPIVFVGKGITFDTGGINLKPTGALDEMHMDMSGGAAVLAALGAIARLKLRVNVVGIIPAVENMPSGSSYRPGDILRSMSGKTIEVCNTDAEGRVVLADALTYAERYDPSLVVDCATLTGACMVALARYASGLFSYDESLVSRLRTYGEQSGDYLWPLPLWEEYEEELKSKVADLSNANKTRNAGATNGALFLAQFAKKFPRWAHVDIASSMTTAPDMFLAAGSRGAATALFVEIARGES